MTSRGPAATLSCMRALTPKQMVQLLVITLLILMGAGVVMMYRSGPPRGQLYAMLQRR